jgi:acyl-CoA reductase-like NAD-dependent aldehyde dehydrogenase
MTERVRVSKTYKLLIGGALVRSESGRTYEVRTKSGDFVANVPSASRKDVRDSVVAAKAGQVKWSELSAYNRGQVIYRLAEMMESRRDELVELYKTLGEKTRARSKLEISEAIDRVVYYAGWTDKIAQVLGSVNPVAGPFFNFSAPRPSGVVGVVAGASLGEFIDQLLAPVAVGCSVVVLAHQQGPLVQLLIGELSLSSDFAPGLVNVLSGSTKELGLVLAAHEEVDGLDLSALSTQEAGPLAGVAAESIKRVLREASGELSRLRAFCETATVWHSVGQ